MRKRTIRGESAKQFVSAFSEHEDLSRLREPGNDDLSVDPAFYLQMAKEIFPNENIELDVRQRWLLICTQLLYRDGRTFLAILHIVKMSLNNKEIARNGCNALLAIVCFLRNQATLPIDIADFHTLLTKCLGVELLENNARHCLSELSRFNEEETL